VTEPISLYVHWPFCVSRCPYCDFNAHVRERLDQRRYRDAILAELAFEAARIGPRPLASIFFGGGTPSLMEPDTAAAIIAAARAAFPAAAEPGISPTAEPEITLEANPTSVELSRLEAFSAAGVNRISLGIQALDEAALAFLGRRHTAAQALEALAMARRLFPRASFDLIYARPGQSVAAWREEVRRALSFGLDHLSLYQLTIEPGTPFERAHARGEITLPDDATQAALHDATVEEAARAGLTPYEVSNYARPGDESRHNLAYWTYADYAGIGPGAHGRIPLGGVPTATVRIRAPEAWMDAVEARGHGVREEEALSAEARAREMLLMGLRLSRGIDPERFVERTGVTLTEALDARTLALALSESWLGWTGEGALAATPSGRLRLDALLPALVR
jgi:oxygen-independent coproporphyrinogen-3 oxidase